MCPDVFWVSSALFANSGLEIREGGNHGEERRAGLVFTYTFYLYSLNPATPWEHLRKASHSARRGANGFINNSTTLIEGT